MGKRTEILRKIAEAATESTGLYVTGISANGEETLIRIYVDSDDPLDMKKLTEVSRIISKQSDEAETGEGKFTIEVSTPGADKPLNTVRQLPKHQGRKLEIEMLDGEKFIALLKEVHGEQLKLEMPPLKKNQPGMERLIQWAEIRIVKVHIGF
jgi:ribosome maturation factor RimP